MEMQSAKNNWKNKQTKLSICLVIILSLGALYTLLVNFETPASDLILYTKTGENQKVYKGDNGKHRSITHKELINITLDTSIAPNDTVNGLYESDSTEKEAMSLFMSSNRANIISAPKVKHVDGLQSSCFYIKSNQKQSLRCLPSVLLAGFPKSGTSHLHSQINLHPHVFMGTYGKEVHFWDHKRNPFSRTVSQYTNSYRFGAALINECCKNRTDSKSNFEKCFNNQTYCINLKYLEKDVDYSKLCENLREVVASGEVCSVTLIDSSPATVWDADQWAREPANKGLTVPAILTAEKVAHVIPAPKIIIVMREPVARLWSDYRFFRRMQKKIVSPQHFHDLITKGITWWKKCIRLLPTIRCAYGSSYKDTPQKESFRINPKWKYTAVNRLRVGMYTLHIQRWFESVPQPNFLFLRLEEFAGHELQILNDKIFPFLNLSSLDYALEKKTPNHANPYGKDVNMFNKSKKILERFYRPFNEELAKLLNDSAYLW